MGFSAVRAFFRVSLQVIQLHFRASRAHQQFPNAIANRKVRTSVAALGEAKGFCVPAVFPKQWPLAGRNCLAKQCRAEIFAINGATLRDFDSGDGAKRREQVGRRENSLLVQSAGRRVAGPTDDERHANAALVEAQLAAAKTTAPAAPKAGQRTVVAREDDQRAPIEA